MSSSSGLVPGRLFRKVIAFGALALLGASVAEAKPKPKPKRGAEPSEDTTAETIRSIAESLKMDVKTTLVSPGDGPVRALKLRPTVGTTQRITMTTATSGKVSVMGMEVNLPNTPIHVDIDHAVTSAARAGSRITARYVDVRIDPVPEDADPLAAMTVTMQSAGYDALVGAEMSYVLDESGRMTDVEMIGGGGAMAAAGDALKTMLEGQKQSQLWLPDEPVGLHAVWTVEQTIQVQNVPLVAVYNFTLSELSESHAAVDLTLNMDMSAFMQGMLAQGSGQLDGVDVGPMQASGSGHYQFRFDQPSPTGEMTMRMLMSMSTPPEDGVSVPMTMDVTARTSIAERP
jgi:hypothetical protein